MHATACLVYRHFTRSLHLVLFVRLFKVALNSFVKLPAGKKVPRFQNHNMIEEEEEEKGGGRQDFCFDLTPNDCLVLHTVLYSTYLWILDVKGIEREEEEGE